MAVAARPGSSDARVPCPLCGGLIHPIAGKCKHCKADLTTYHAVRPAASAPLPALHPAPGTNGHASAHMAQAPGHAAPTSVAAAYDASQPVLPPRPTSASYPAEPRSSGLRSWPVLVIILATVAIIVAVVLMVWPTSQHDLEGKHTLAPPPAPERMQTHPEVKQPLPQAPTRPAPPPLPPAGATSDPWSQNQVDPPPADPGAHPLDRDDSDDADDLGGLQNPFASPNPPPTAPGRRRLPINGNGTMMLALMEHVCRKMVECNAGDPMTKSTCDALAHRSLPPPANCPAANRCLHLIDAMSCGSQADNLAHLSSLMLQLRDCTEAIRC